MSSEVHRQNGELTTMRIQLRPPVASVLGREGGVRGARGCVELQRGWWWSIAGGQAWGAAERGAEPGDFDGTAGQHVEH